eukprot:2672254-Prymnesium_polylepis.1
MASSVFHRPRPRTSAGVATVSAAAAIVTRHQCRVMSAAVSTPSATAHTSGWYIAKVHVVNGVLSPVGEKAGHTCRFSGGHGCASSYLIHWLARFQGCESSTMNHMSRPPPSP